jgi:hypothetical protein
VRRWSTIRIGGRTYSVPSRLIGYQVEVRQHPDHLEVRYDGRTIETMPRLRGSADRRVDYRHVIRSLVRKPGAFARYRYREELFPSLVFRRAYDRLRERQGERADLDYLRILYLAARTMECRVEEALRQLLASAEPWDYASVKAIVEPEMPAPPEMATLAPDVHGYDELLLGDAS